MAKQQRRIRPQQELFLREYIRTGVQTEAYIAAYGGSVRNAHMNSWRLLARPHVAHRYEQLTGKLMKRADITIEKILLDYQDALDMAKEQRRSADMTAAATAQAKLVGLLRERVEAGQVGDFDNVTNVSEILEMVAKEAGPAAALALAKAFNVTGALPDQQEPVDDQGASLASQKPASDAVN